MTTKTSQKDKILRKLQKTGRFSQGDARKMGILSPSSRINELRRAGHPINNKGFTRHGRTSVVYVLAA